MKTLKDNSQKKLKGIFFIILSAFCFACMSIFVRMSGDLPAYEKSFFRNLIAFFVAVILVINGRKTTKIKIKKQDCIDLIARAVFGCIGIVCNFYAIDHMLVADASALNKLSPFFVIIFSFFILKEKVKLKQIFYVVIAFIGMLFVIKPGFSDISLLPALAGICGGMCAGLAYTFVRKLGKQGVPSSFIVLSFSAFSCISMVPMMLVDFRVASGAQIAMLLGAGVSAAGGQFSITAAYTYAPAREISIYDYFQIIFITILSYFILDEVPDAYSFIGYFIILVASLAMFFYHKGKE